jgi:hypothetical protein
MAIFRRTIIYVVVGIGTTLLSKRLFPEKKKELELSDSDIIRGGDNVIKIPLLTKLLTDRSLKIGLLAIFGTHMLIDYSDQLKQALMSQAMIEYAMRREGVCADRINRIATENELYKHSLVMRELLLDKNLTVLEKGQFLYYKIEAILRGKSPKRKRYILLALIGCSLTGVGGLCIILEALRKLWEDGQISDALYRELVKHAKKQHSIPN